MRLDQGNLQFEHVEKGWMGRSEVNVKWQGYLRRYPNSSGARLLLTIGGRTASETDSKIQAQLKAGKIDSETYSDWTELLADWRDSFKGNSPWVDHHDSSDWRQISPGGYQRRNHLGGQNR